MTDLPEKEKIYATDYERYKMSSLKTKHNDDFTMYKHVTSGLEKTSTVGSWQVSLLSLFCLHT